jgi:hypothetical protein
MEAHTSFIDYVITFNKIDRIKLLIILEIKWIAAKLDMCHWRYKCSFELGI